MVLSAICPISYSFAVKESTVSDEVMTKKEIKTQEIKATANTMSLLAFLEKNPLMESPHGGDYAYFEATVSIITILAYWT